MSVMPHRAREFATMFGDAETRHREEGPNRQLVPVQPGAVCTADRGEQTSCGAEGGARGCGGCIVLGTREHTRGGGRRAGCLARTAHGASGGDAFAREPSDAVRRRVRHVLAPLPGLSRRFPSGNRYGGLARPDRGLARLEIDMAMRKDN